MMLEKKVVISTKKEIEFVSVSDIMKCEAKGKFADCYLNDRKIESNKALKDFDVSLGSFGFFRVSHSCLINLMYVKSYCKKTKQVILNNNEGVSLSTSRKKDFMSKFLNI